ncbi:CDP-2,3-bis-(O-geranylgeranyl)-sn-glycerol synthase [Stygiolobus azoricus]|uniref:CDP-archaeol synthase n=1 Tax=Stygiolobus azoricus TaxID=41675 RepID=A0A650CLV2_9CREN|nr:CDP-2,3-bis-(O-geranylgeranyl)-sn-glycerol synthase [Stygiolobus azoricus]QGR18789.1 CDP-2,3-bis-(O-geranylgeranyl)-sn-glycerol synthase [Stygiolobus azoricus]
MLIAALLIGIVYYLPALAANGSAPFVKNGTPIDFRKKLNDGRRILGDGKTFEGLLLAVTFGTTVGAIISRFLGNEWIFIAFFESLAAMIGDMIGAFIKRRLGMERGQRAPLLDQLDFFVFSTLALVLMHVKIQIVQILFIGILVIFLHLFTNYVAFRLKIKSVPW